MGLGTVVFLLCVAVAASVDPTPCCYPNQFVIGSGSTVGISGQGGSYVIYSYSRLAFDFDNNRAGALITVIVGPGKTSNYKTITNYETQEKYVIDVEAQKCEVFENPGELVRCVNANATFLQSVYLGDNKLTVDSFGFSFRKGGSAGYVTQTVTQGDCLPSSVTFQGRAGRSSLLSVTGFFNYVDGIENPSEFFDVPDFCPQSISKDLPLRKFILGHIIF